MRQDTSRAISRRRTVGAQHYAVPELGPGPELQTRGADDVDMWREPLASSGRNVIPSPFRRVQPLGTADKRDGARPEWNALRPGKRNNVQLHAYIEGNGLRERRTAVNPHVFPA